MLSKEEWLESVKWKYVVEACSGFGTGCGLRDKILDDLYETERKLEEEKRKVKRLSCGYGKLKKKTAPDIYAMFNHFMNTRSSGAFRYRRN